MWPTFSMQGVSEVAKLNLQIICYYNIDICLCISHNSNHGCNRTHTQYKVRK
jgi:hypothetical protein